MQRKKPRATRPLEAPTGALWRQTRGASQPAAALDLASLGGAAEALLLRVLSPGRGARVAQVADLVALLDVLLCEEAEAAPAAVRVEVGLERPHHEVGVAPKVDEGADVPHGESVDELIARGGAALKDVVADALVQPRPAPLLLGADELADVLAHKIVLPDVLCGLHAPHCGRLRALGQEEAQLLLHARRARELSGDGLLLARQGRQHVKGDLLRGVHKQGRLHRLAAWADCRRDLDLGVKRHEHVSELLHERALRELSGHVLEPPALKQPARHAELSLGARVRPSRARPPQRNHLARRRRPSCLVELGADGSARGARGRLQGGFVLRFGSRAAGRVNQPRRRAGDLVEEERALVGAVPLLDLRVVRLPFDLQEGACERAAAADIEPREEGEPRLAPLRCGALLRLAALRLVALAARRTAVAQQPAVLCRRLHPLLPEEEEEKQLERLPLPAAAHS
mmetsp:Transcript_21850/g.72374  ORF Transcript_21850/g.72374 Transcript_21850/m.72374 type:complete len:456 (-) Transcript_21850:379-1746(-)